MTLRSKIVLFFAGSFPVVLGIALLSVYFSMAEYREKEFLQRLKDKTTTTLQLLIDVKDLEHDLLQALGKSTVNSLYDEKILLFDSTGTLIYSSVDDTAVLFPGELLNDLKEGEDEIFYRDGEYDVYAHILFRNGEKYYAIGKANDQYGKVKLQFLVWTLLGVFVAAVIMEILVALYLARQITRPITHLTDEINSKSINNLSKIQVPATGDEIATLANGFNGMLARVEQSYEYQKNVIHHVSHELKTPIAVLISNIERVLNEKEPRGWQESLEFQKNGLMQMSSVVTTLLDISKFETNPDQLFTESVRLDELVFTCLDGLQAVQPAATFELSISEEVKDAEELRCAGNERLLQIAFQNILKNAIEYSKDKRVVVAIGREGNHVVACIDNNGPTLTLAEQDRIFTYFFRGSNSHGKVGIGLGLVMVSKVIDLHGGTISYQITSDGRNRFRISLHRS